MEDVLWAVGPFAGSFVLAAAFGYASRRLDGSEEAAVLAGVLAPVVTVVILYEIFRWQLNAASDAAVTWEIPPNYQHWPHFWHAGSLYTFFEERIANWIGIPWLLIVSGIAGFVAWPRHRNSDEPEPLDP